MITALLLGTLAVTQTPVDPASGAVFACSYVKNEKSDPDSHVVDLRAERRRGSDGEIWVLDFADGTSASGSPTTSLLDRRRAWSIDALSTALRA